MTNTNAIEAAYMKFQEQAERPQSNDETLELVRRISLFALDVSVPDDLALALAEVTDLLDELAADSASNNE